MFQVIPNLTLEEEEFIEDYFSSQDLEIDQYEELPDPTQFVEVSNPEFIETMLSNDAAPLEALLDFQANLSNLNLINTEPATKQNLSFSTPVKKDVEPSTPTIPFNQIIFDTPIMSHKDSAVETPYRKTFGGKTVIMYDHYAVDEIEEEEIDILGDNEIDILGVEDSPTVISSTKKRKISKTPKTGKKKPKSPKTKKANNPDSVVYNILTKLDTPPLKAKDLERNISKVFQGEELLRMQKNCEEDDIVDII